jgi:nicotinate phosphoribosyltransferase
MVTGKPDAALDGVYKLVSLNEIPRMKISENPEKTTLPGKKQLVRYFDGEGQFFRDGILLEDEKPAETGMICHPFYPKKHTTVSNLHCENLLSEVVKDGRILPVPRNLNDIHVYLLTRTACLPAEHKRFVSPHIYKVGISQKLMNLRNELSEKYNH